MRLDISGASQADGANVQLQTSNGNKAQRFILEKVGGNNARTIAEKTKSSGLPESTTGFRHRYAPNPAHRSVQLHFPKAEQAQFQLYDITGKLLLNKNYSDQSSAKVMIDQLLAGVYLVRLQADGEHYQQRLVIE